MINLIIPAAGLGSRFSSNIPKQFTKISNKEILRFNILKWLNIKSIDKIYLLLPQLEFESNKIKYTKLSKRVIPLIGGNSRAESINNAIINIDKQNQITLIHDGARPFFSEELVNRVLDGLLEHEAIIPALKITDTVKLLDGEKIVKTVNRNNLIVVQTPQGFNTDLIIKAYKSIDVTRSNFDDSELIENIGENVFFVNGDRNNIKITTQDDIEFCEYLLSKES